MKTLTINAAKQIDIVNYLGALGHLPDTKMSRGSEYWYLSPLPGRNEKTPSFKVDRKKNLWFDHGIGAGGSIIDFGIRYFRCSIIEFLRILENVIPAPPGLSSPVDFSNVTAEVLGNKMQCNNRITIISIENIKNESLRRYLQNRKISLPVAVRYCLEIHYKVGNRKFFSVGFKNYLGGFELRSPAYKGSISPKSFTLIENGFAQLEVFEGFFDFLSYLTISERFVKESSHLILNSLSFIEKSLPVIEKYQHVNLYLDNDEPSRKYTAFLQNKLKSCTDCSFVYKDFKDFNQWLMETDHLKQRENLIKKFHL